MRPWLVLSLSVLLTAVLSGCFGGGKDDAASEDLQVPPEDLLNETAAPPVVVPPAPRWPHFPSDGASEKTLLELESFDGHMIPVTIYRPLIANATQQVPVLLQSHGFTGSRATADDAFKEIVAAGFGVVSFDERGHGDAKDDSEVYFMHPDYEVQDVIRVVDEVATYDWVLMEAPGDPLLGGIGGSYGGAFQLMGAIFDSRFDAIVPEITWNDITEALAPNGAVKSGWVDLFYIAGNAEQSVKFSNDFHIGWAWAAATNTFPAGQAPGVPDLHTRLKESSPVSYPGNLTIPTLLIQGMPDTLFPLNQAVANLRMLEAANVTASLYTHLGGHILNTESLAPGTVPGGAGLQGIPGGKPCGELVDLQIAWHQKWLLELPVDTGPRVCISLEDETAVTGETFPLENTTMQAFSFPGPYPIAQAPAGPEIEIPLGAVAEETVVAGIPVLNGTLTSPGADAIVYFSLKVAGRTGLEAIVDDQVVPLRIAGPNTASAPFSVELGGVGVRLMPGDELILVASTVEPMYFGNAERVPGAVVLEGLELLLPVVATAGAAA